jgi:hypothetical protein
MQGYSTSVTDGHWIMSFNTEATGTGTWLKDKQLHVILNKTTYAPQIAPGIRKHSSQAFPVFLYSTF